MATAGSPAVAVVLVSHSGERWLPGVLNGLDAQTHRPTHLIAVDTGSRDAGAELIRERWGAESVITAGRRTSYPEAVQTGVRALADAGAEPDWIWLLHDDSAPAPTALAELLAAADADPDAAVLGPKLREWPSLRRLLELGVTISGTGRRERGLEQGEYDQGQHDEVRRVLAVNTAGMLVRAEVWDRLGGLDPALPVFGNDIDFGWRAARAGHRTLIVPQAVLFHAEAAHRGLRVTSLTGRHTHFQERRAALFTLLANTSGRALVWQVMRLIAGTLLRVLGFLAVRSPGEAADEAAALFHVLARPGAIRDARRSRRRTASVPHADVKPLLAPWWLPYRHGLDFVTDLAEAATNQAADVAQRRRAAALADAGPGALPAAHARAVRSDLDALNEEEDLGEDTGWLARFVTSPVALGLAAVLVAMSIGTRAAWGPIAGGGLSPAPERSADWWRLYLEHTHPLSLGTEVVAPAYVAVLAALGSVLGGSAPAAVSALLLASMPVALWGAWRLLRVVARFLDPAGAPTWLLAVGAATYALVPALSGAWSQGRLGPVVATALVPWLFHALLSLADPEPDRRWRAAWRSGLLLAVVAAFAPVIWVFCAGLALVVFALAAAFSRALVRDTSVSLPPLAALLVPIVLLLPWWLPMISSGDAGGLLLEPGRLPPAAAEARDLLLGRIEGGGPAWFGLPVLVAAVGALLHPRSRPAALVGWTVCLVAAATAALVTSHVIDLRVQPVRPSAASLLPVLTGALVVAALAGALALLRADWGRAARLRRPLGAVAVLAALAGPVLGAAWFVTTSSDVLGDPETQGAAEDIPAYMQQSSALGPDHGVLVVRGDIESGLTYLIRREDGVTLGEDEIVALTAPDAGFERTLTTLLTRPSAAAVTKLADAGIEYVVFPAPADGRLAARLDATTGLSQASAENRSTRAWLVDAEPSEGFAPASRSTARTALVAAQGVAVVVIAVLCGPARGPRRRGRVADEEEAS